MPTYAEAPAYVPGVDSPIHGSAAQKFNSWVIGGGYSKAQMKRNQIRTDLAVQKRDAVPRASPLDDRLEARKRSLRHEQAREIPKYKPKAAEATREERRKAAETEFAKRRSASPNGRLSAEDRAAQAAATFRREHPPETADNAAVLRDRLRHSFEVPHKSRGYHTMFPPLLHPYARPMTHLRGRERSPSPKRLLQASGGGLGMLGGTNGSLPPPRTLEPFAAPQKERRREQPTTGPKPFLPTGSSTTAYRLLTNYSQLVRGTASAEDPHQASSSNQGESFDAAGVSVTAQREQMGAPVPQAA